MESTTDEGVFGLPRRWRKVLSLVGLTPILEDARRQRYAVGAFNFCNAETVQAIVEEGWAQRSPIILIISPLEIQLLGYKRTVDVTKAIIKDIDVPICLHLDHAGRIADIEDAIEAGFPSVMIDASGQDFEENIRLTKVVVEMAHRRGVSVEAELGAVGRADDVVVEGARISTTTDPALAAEFVERTGVDALAVSIGNAHGIYPQSPELDFDRLQAIRDRVEVELVLHGGSGTPPDQLASAIEIGITKVNVASELGRAYLDAIKQGMDDKLWYASSLINAKAAIRPVVGRWIQQLGCAGKVA